MRASTADASPIGGPDGARVQDAASAADADATIDPVAIACGGARPVASACRVGLFHQDCGGDGPSVFGCSTMFGRCAWFTGGCAPDGAVLTTCAAPNICCRSSTAGSWPFPGDWVAGDHNARRSLEEAIAAAGHTPVTADSPATLAVTIDPTFVSAGPGFSCTPGGASVLALCEHPTATVMPFAMGDSLVLRIRHASVIGIQLLVEIVSGPVPIGRTFVVFQDDSSPAGVAPSCEAALSPGLASFTGSVTLDRIDVGAPLETHGRVELDLPGGARLTAEF